MSRWSRRYHRQQPPAPLSLLPPCASVSLPDNCPADVRELAIMVGIEGPDLLAGFDPDEVGLLLVHPTSEACPAAAARANRVHARVEPVDELRALAQRCGLVARHRPGWYLALLVGRDHTAVIDTAPLERLVYEQEAS